MVALGTSVPRSPDAGPFNGSRHDVRTWGAWRGARYRRYGVVPIRPWHVLGKACKHVTYSLVGLV